MFKQPGAGADTQTQKHESKAVAVTTVQGASAPPAVESSTGGPWWRSAPTVLGVVGWIAVAILALWRAHAALGNGSVGWDLNPLRIAGDDLRSGHSIYSNPNFVYPPPAALVGWALSFARPHTVAAVYTYCEVIAIGLTVLVLRGCLRPQRWQLAVSAVVAGLLLRGDLVNSILWLDNASVLLVLPCAFVLVRMGDGKWRSGAVVLGLTLLLKPVLLPLILVPLVLRHWRAVAETIGVVVIGLLVSVPLTNGAGSIGQVVRHLAGGSNLTGWQAVFNTSLAQFGDYHHVPTGLTILARLIVVATAGMAIVRVTRGTRNPTRPLVVALGTLLLSAVFLAGPLAENHYLILLIPGALLMVTLDDRLVLGLVVAALAVAAYPAAYAHGLGDSVVSMQARCVVIQLLVFAAAVRASMTWPGMDHSSADVPLAEQAASDSLGSEPPESSTSTSSVG